MNEKEMLDTITELSHYYGVEKFVHAGGGNTSCKSADTLWVKPSGTTLLGLTPSSFVKMDRSKLARLYEVEPPAEATAREALVKTMMAEAVLPETAGRRASVEASLHDSLSARFVVHTHPAWVNGLTCSLTGEIVARKFFPDSLWIPYTDPGYTLAMEVRKAVASYKTAHGGAEPKLIFLGNHGVFVSADTAEEIHAIYDDLEAKLFGAYRAAGVDACKLVKGTSKVDPAKVEEWKRVLAEAWGEEASFVACSAPFDVAVGPITPDHMVYSKSFPYFGIMTVENLKNIKAVRGYCPRVIVTPEAVLGVGKSEKVANLALELAEDGALVKQAASVFGGVQYMSDRSRLFIENWEVEAFRAQQQQA